MSQTSTAKKAEGDDPPSFSGRDHLGAFAMGAAPHAFALLAFLCGGVLLATSAFPALAPRMALLADAAPLLVIELSHFAASVVGLLLLIVAAGLWRKREGAYAAALLLLIIGALAALLRGLDYEEAALLGGVALGLYACRGAFVRRSRLLREPLTLPWFAGIAATLAGAAALGYFAYREIAYTDELWWTFLRDGDASRFLRAEIAVAFVAALIALTQLFAAPRTRWRGEPSAEDVARAAAVLRKPETLARPDAWLALARDKDLMFSPSGESFVMFRARGRRWTAMGLPAGRADERRALAWAFAEAADEAGALPVFYALGAEDLAIPAEMGFVARKIGETACVPVQSFTLEGRTRQNLRTARNKLEREGCVFELCAPGSAPLDELRAVSDAWLAAHQGTEKGFSMGRFDADYLRETPIALVRQNGRVVAFANVWRAGREIAIDLMRHASDAPRGVMDFLFVKLIAWAQTEGVETLDLGMAPLSGLEARRLAPATTQIGAAVYAEGERVYGFRGLRAYKDKFDPEWRPVFLAAPPGVSVPLALLDVALLTSNGWRGLFGLR